MGVEYSLTCDNCGVRFLNADAFPEPQYCFHCLVAFKAGIKEVVKWIRAHPLIQPDDDSITKFEPFYQIEQSELKKWEV